MIYDVCFFNNENELLEIRINEYKEYIDKFILIIGDRTFQGNQKTNNIEDIYEKFRDIKGKIEIFEIKLNSSPSNSWENEFVTLNYLNKIKSIFVDEDIIVTSDVDEILNISTLKKIRTLKKFPSVVEIAVRYYYLNGRVISGYSHDRGPIILRSKNLETQLVDLRKKRSEMHILKNGGWHFSFIGGVKRIREKISSYSHSEFNNNSITGEEALRKKTENGLDIFQRPAGHQHFKGDERSFKIFYETIDNTYPNYVQKNISKFKNLIFKKATELQFTEAELKNYFKENENYISSLCIQLKNEKEKSEYLYYELNKIKEKIEYAKKNPIKFIFKKILEKIL